VQSVARCSRRNPQVLDTSTVIRVDRRRPFSSWHRIALAGEILAFASIGPYLYWISSILVALSITIVVARFGLLATMTAQLFFFLSVTYPLTTDFSAWYASSTIFALVVALGISVYGFYTSLGGRRVFADRLLGEPLRN
jgi:hypothetical protein